MRICCALRSSSTSETLPCRTKGTRSTDKTSGLDSQCARFSKTYRQIMHTLYTLQAKADEPNKSHIFYYKHHVFSLITLTASVSGSKKLIRCCVLPIKVGTQLFNWQCTHSVRRVTLSISILISLHVFFLLVVEIIPPTSLVVPLLGKYLIFAMILVSISICVTVVVLNVHFRSPQTHRMAPLVKRVFVNLLPQFLFIKRPKYNIETR
nr:acetylcholine receptor subunit alpha-like 1 [Bactrocera oleae]